MRRRVAFAMVSENSPADSGVFSASSAPSGFSGASSPNTSPSRSYIAVAAGEGSSPASGGENLIIKSWLPARSIGQVDFERPVLVRVPAELLAVQEERGDGVEAVADQTQALIGCQAVG